MATGGPSATEILQQATAGGTGDCMHDGATGSTTRTTGSLQPVLHAAGLYQIVTVTQEDQDNMFVRPHSRPKKSCLVRFAHTESCTFILRATRCIYRYCKELTEQSHPLLTMHMDCCCIGQSAFA